MKKSKKLIALLLAAVMLFALAACNNEETPGTGDEVGTTAGSATDTYTIGICQFVQHDALDAATKGFQDYLTEQLGDRVEFSYQNASGEKTNCTTIVSQFVASNVDLIMANATDALVAAAAATEDIPILGTSITDYATALQIDNWTGTTGMNISGTADLAPLDQQAAMIKELCPDAKEVGILYCSAESNSKYQADVVAEELQKLGLTSTVYTFVDTNDVQQVMQTAVDNGRGSVYQFFTGPGKEYLPDLVDSFTAIGCPKLADLMQKVVDLAIQEQSGQIADVDVDEEDDAPSFQTYTFDFMDLCEEEQIEDKLANYIRQHKATFLN